MRCQLALGKIFCDFFFVFMHMMGYHDYFICFHEDAGITAFSSETSFLYFQQLVGFVFSAILCFHIDAGFVFLPVLDSLPTEQKQAGEYPACFKHYKHPLPSLAPIMHKNPNLSVTGVTVLAHAEENGARLAQLRPRAFVGT